MPTYQYACTECGEQLEAVQKFTDDPLTVCPACDGRLRKVFNSVGIVFKGPGFYRTDSRKGSTASTPAASSASSSSSDAGSAAAASSSDSSSSSTSKSADSSGSASSKSSSSTSSGGSSSSAAGKAATA